MQKINSFIFRLKKNTFWKSVAVLVSGTALAQVLGILTTPIVSRLYDPVEFGQYAIIISTTTIITSIVTLGLNSAVMVPISDDESKEVFTVAFFSMLLFSTLIFLAMIISSPLLHLFKPGINYILACVLVYILTLINSSKGLLIVFVNRKGMNRVLFYNSLIGAFATLCITIPMGMVDFGSAGLLVAAIIGGLISIIQMVFHVNPFGELPRLSSYKKIYKKYKDFVIYQYPSNFIANFVIQLPTQVFSSVFGNANLGSYSMNEKILGIPTRLIAAPINTIYFRTASEYQKTGKNLADFTFSLVTRIMLIALLPIFITIIWGEQIFSFVLGSNWADAGKLAGFLIVQYVFMFSATCTSYCRVVLGKQKANLIISLLRLAIIGISIFFGVYFFRDLFKTIILFTIGSSLYLIIDMAINFYYLQKYWVKYIIFALLYISGIIILMLIVGRVA